MPEGVERVLVFGDDYGAPQVLRYLPRENVIGLVGASIRPAQHACLRELAESFELPFLIHPRHTDETYLDFVQTIRNLHPDLILVNSYSMLLQPEILSIPLQGCVNVHGALLPQYRGANPIQWALLNDEKETGVTMHYMDESFDTGDIIAQQHVPIYFEDTWRDVQARIAEATERMLADELPRLLAGNSARRPQDSSKARYYKRRRPEDGLINWNCSVLYIYNLIRALVQPHPGAFYFQENGIKVTLDQYMSISEVVSMKYGAPGGQILESGSMRLIPDSCKHQNHLVSFHVYNFVNKKDVGLCSLTNIDWNTRTASLCIDVKGHVNKDELIHLLKNFAAQQLSLRIVE